MNICILGTGAYAVALALNIKQNKYNIKMWNKFEEEKNFILKNKYTKTLPNVIIPSNIEITCDMKEAVRGSNLIIVAIPIEAINDAMKELAQYFTNDMHICIATKGIEKNTSLFASQIIKKYINSDNICVLSGPTFAIDMANNNIVGLSLATTNNVTKQIVVDSFNTDIINISYSDDIIGTQICGTIKNIVALAAGVLNGLGVPESTLFSLITKSLVDINKIINCLGGKETTFFSYAGIGDLILTCTTRKSRNFTLGNLIGKNSSIDVINDYIKNNTVEGLYSLTGFYNLLRTKNISIYLIELIYDIINNKKEAKELLNYIVNQ